jgi:methyl-accepting chemotaxis protein
VLFRSTTQEIARNLGQAARGAADVTANIAGVSSAAESSSAASGQVLGAAAELSRQAVALRSAVEGFLHDVRAA